MPKVTSKNHISHLRLVIVVAVVVVVLLSTVSIIILKGRPPHEDKLVSSFRDHKIAFDRLRDMFKQDNGVVAVYTRFGVETKKSGLPRPPSEIGFPAERYNAYVALLKEVNGSEIFRLPERESGVCITVWASGFAGKTQRASDCWLPVTNESANITGGVPRQGIAPRYRQIESDWYLRFDQ
jgi:hypothetical protein